MRPFVCAVLVVLAVACSRKSSEENLAASASSPPVAPAQVPAPAPAQASAPAPAQGFAPAPGSPALALRWEDPPRWKRVRPSTSMRVAEYAVPRASGDAEDANCSVFTFGPGQGGGVDDNVDRWVRQFDPIASGPTKTTRNVNGMPITRIEASGTFHPMQMPGMPAAPESSGRSGLVGAIVQSPSGLWFFKMTGPAATVKAAASELDRLIDSVQPK